MKRLPLFALLLLPLSSRAQEGDVSPEAAPAETQSEGAPPGEDAPISVPGSDSTPAGDESATAVMPADGGDDRNPADKPAKEEPVISVKVESPTGDEGDGKGLAPAAEKKRVEPTATLMPRKGKGRPARNPSVVKAEKAPPAPVKAKAPAVPAEPPPPPVPAVPLTPITPRNP